jgi:hypothetical protein
MVSISEAWLQRVVRKSSSQILENLREILEFACDYPNGYTKEKFIYAKLNNVIKSKLS